MNDNGLSASDVALLTGNNNNDGFGGNSWSGLIWLFAIIALMNGGFGSWGNGGFGGMGNMQLGYDFPWLLNGQNGINNNMSDGFRTAQLQDSVSSIRSGIGDLSTQLCGGFGNVQTSLANGFAGNIAAINSGVGDIQNALCSGFANTNSNIANASTNIQMGLANGFAGTNAAIAGASNDIQMGLANGFSGTQMSLANGFANTASAITGAQNAMTQQMYTNQIADLERSFAAQTASTQGMNTIQSQLAQCCCDQRAATADLKYTVATENCADRTAAAQNTRDIIDAQTRGTQAILDKLCQLELDGVKGQLAQAQRENVGLQNQVNMATFRESQANQNALIQNGFANEIDALYNRLNSCPVPTTPVYGRTPIFTCNNGGCGCNNGVNL